MNLNTLLNATIAKGAGRVVRKPLAALRHDVAELKRTVNALKREVARLRKTAPSVEAAAVVGTSDEGAEMARMRPSGAMVRKLRAKLGVTQAEFAKLAGVSTLSVSKWERTDGRIKLRGHTVAGLGRVRGLSKRTARKELDMKSE